VNPDASPPLRSGFPPFALIFLSQSHKRRQSRCFASASIGISSVCAYIFIPITQTSSIPTLLLFFYRDFLCFRLFFYPNHTNVVNPDASPPLRSAFPPFAFIFLSQLRKRRQPAPVFPSIQQSCFPEYSFAPASARVRLTTTVHSVVCT